jgi:phosphoribosylglycinamide formyltransferase-1
MSTATVPVVLLLSGSGCTLANFLDNIAAGSLPIEIAAVVSSRPNVRGVAIAREADIPCRAFRRKDFPSSREHNEAINAWLMTFRPRMILLAGYLCYYMRPPGFAGPILNIHPALLPKYGGKGFYGERVHAAVLAARETETGCTVHLVDEVYDHGLILDQRRVPVYPDDDVQNLAARVFTAECELYPAVVARLARQLLGA